MADEDGSGVSAGWSGVLTGAVASGDRRVALEALRDRLAAEVERVAEEGFCQSCRRGSSSIAPLSKQLTDVLGVLATLEDPDAEKAEDSVDDLARRRAERRAAAEAAARSGEGV